jgi:AraC-like DNA-binding protein
MTTSGHFLSAERQARLTSYETSRRVVVGYAADFEDGLVTGTHAHPKAQLLYAVRGTMHIEVTGSVFTVPPTTALFIPTNLPHSVRMRGAVAQRQLFIGSSFDGLVSEAVRVISVSPLLREVVVALCAEGADWLRPDRAGYLAAITLDEIQRATALPFDLPLPVDPRLRRVTSAILASLNDRRTLTDWSMDAGASERTLGRLFVRETGLTFAQWRQQARLIDAYVSLSMGAKPAATASAAGYASPPAFGAAFRAFFGCTPGAVRGRVGKRVYGT